MWTIYLIHNVQSHKLYVGQTKNFATRKNAHFAALARGKHKNPHLQRAYNFYGASVFEVEAIEECSSSEECNLAEVWWVSYLNFVGATLYNVRGGGDCGGTIGQTTREKLRQAALRRTPKTPAMKALVSCQFKGKTLTVEHREKLRKAALKRWAKPESKLAAKNWSRAAWQNPQRKLAVSQRMTKIWAYRRGVNI